MDKLKSIQVLRGLAILGVVAFHLITIEKKYSGGDLLIPNVFLLGQSGVDLFFVISGFVMVMISRGRFESNNEIKRFLWGRLTRIYPTYWFYFILTVGVFLAIPAWVNTSQGHQANLIYSFFLLPDKKLPLVMVAWSLIHELWFYLIFAIFLRFSDRLLMSLLFTWGLIVTMANLFLEPLSFPPFTRIIFHPYSLEFIIGALVALLFFKGYLLNFQRRWSYLLLGLILVSGLSFVYFSNLLNNQGLLRSFTMGCLYGFLLYVTVVMEHSGKFRAPTSLFFLGNVSYTIYLSHILVLSAVGRLWSMTSPIKNNLFDNYLVILFMMMSVIGYGWMGYHLIEKPMLQISYRLRTQWFDKPLSSN